MQLKTGNMADDADGSVSLYRYDVGTGESVAYPSAGNPFLTGTEYSREEETVLYQVLGERLSSRNHAISPSRFLMLP